MPDALTPPPRRILLASASPRRLQLLQQLGLQPEVVPVDLDESALAGETPEQHVRRLALAKARAGWHRAGADPGCLVLGADTLIELDGEALGKPCDAIHGQAMLARLSGRSHTVLSAVALVGAEEQLCLSRTEVEFGPIDAAAAEAYWRSGEPRDKAGGYAIQGLGAVFVKRITGSYSGVMGLPLYETAAMLGKFGVSVLEGLDGH